jgi:Cys-tRNA(Pro)/Cys-tRNA(Cys) deacylase
LRQLQAAGIAHTVHPYPSTGGRGHGEKAALALGVDPCRLLKTLVVSADGHLAVALVPVADQLDLKAMAVALQAKKVVLAAPVQAERSTGYVTGGISPLGQRRRLLTVLDDSAMAFDTVLVSAGRRGLQVELAPADLRRATCATLAALTR